MAIITKPNEESSHWYTRDGESMHQIPTANGKSYRQTTVADARQMGLLPSVTSILTILNKQQLEKWKLKQAVAACIRTIREKDESDDYYINRVLNEAHQQVDDAADTGTELHAILEAVVSGKNFDLKQKIAYPTLKKSYPAYIALEALLDWFVEKEIEFVGPESRIVNLKYGFAGTVDAPFKYGVNGIGVLDYKTRRTKPNEPVTAYDGQVMQIAAYAATYWGEENLCRCFGANLYISTTEPGRVDLVRYGPDELIRAFECFKSLVQAWIYLKGYDPLAWGTDSPRVSRGGVSIQVVAPHPDPDSEMACPVVPLPTPEASSPPPIPEVPLPPPSIPEIPNVSIEEAPSIPPVLPVPPSIEKLNRAVEAVKTKTVHEIYEEETRKLGESGELPEALKMLWGATKSFDWYYDMSDDPRVFARGEASKQKLLAKYKEAFSLDQMRALTIWNINAAADVFHRDIKEESPQMISLATIASSIKWSMIPSKKDIPTNIKQAFSAALLINPYAAVYIWNSHAPESMWKSAPSEVSKMQKEIEDKPEPEKETVKKSEVAQLRDDFAALVPGSSHKIPFGKHKGKQLGELPRPYVEWLSKQTEGVLLAHPIIRDWVKHPTVIKFITSQAENLNHNV